MTKSENSPKMSLTKMILLSLITGLAFGVVLNLVMPMFGETVNTFITT